MAGTISQLPNNGRFYVSWYDKHSRKTWKIYKYKGLYLYDRRTADKLLSNMQNDVENGCFRLEKYTVGETDVIPYLTEWLEAIAPTLSPATYANYNNSIQNHLTPFYRSKPLSLNEIAHDNLVQLLNSIKREGVGKKCVMACLHACLTYAWEAGRIQYLPKFPKKSMYQIVERPIRWLSSEDQRKVIEAIPLEHQPIFWWLKYHLRRPGEAMALHKEDYQNGIFIVHRGISAKKLAASNKTHTVHPVPMVSEYVPYVKIEEDKQKRHGILSPFFFVFPDGRTAGRRYTDQALNKLWAAACDLVGISIDLYSGLKHSTASQMVNEDGYSLSDVQAAGQWANLDMVKKYAKTETSRVKALLERKVVGLGSSARHGESEVTENKGQKS